MDSFKEISKHLGGRNEDLMLTARLNHLHSLNLNATWTIFYSLQLMK